MVKRKQLNKADQKFYEANREYKSSLFCISFQEKKDLLDLYNAINGSDYQDPEELTIYTIEDAVDEAIDRCIEENILKELLPKCRGEVRDMVLTTFNKELYERDLKEEGMAAGELLRDIELIQKKCRKNKSLPKIAAELEKDVQNIEPIYLLVMENPDKTEKDILAMIQGEAV